MIKTSHTGIFYVIAKRTIKKVYYGRYTDSEGKAQKLKLGGSLTIAVKKLNKLKRNTNKEELQEIYGKEIGALLAKLTVEKVYETYINIEGNRWSYQELKTKKSRFRKWILPRFGKMLIDDVNYSHVQEFINNLDERNTNKSIKCSRKSQENIKSSIQSFFKFCYKEGLTVKPNPAQYVSIKAYDNHVPMTLTLDQIIKFYKTIIDIDTTDLENRKKRLMLVLMIHGRRWSEARFLCWSEIEFLANLYSIPAHKSKTKKTQKYKMTDFLRKELLEMRLYCDSQKEDYIFVNANTNQPFTTISKFFKSIKIASDIPISFRCQDFRHVVGTVGYQVLESPLENIRDALGHGTVKTTEIYSDKHSENAKKVIDNLFNLFDF